MKAALRHSKTLAFTVVGVLGFSFLSGCANKGFEAKRMDDRGIDEKAMKVTDNWVQGDTILVIDETMNKMMNHPKLRKYMNQRGGKSAKLFVGEITNMTAEPYFPVKDLEEALLEKVSVMDEFTLIDAEKRERLLKEIQYQNSGAVDPAQAKKLGKQSGADLLIFGTVIMKPEMRDGKTVKTYSVNLNLTDLQTSEEVSRTRALINKFSQQ